MSIDQSDPSHIPFIIKKLASIINIIKKFKRKKETPCLSSNNDILIPEKYINPHSLKIIKKLRQYGYQAFLVGGCIRDFLLHLSPKDFDVVTDAYPEQIRKIFSNSRIIGRRFKLVHVYYGSENIEVATFRAHHKTIHTDQQALQNEQGRILVDNIYGSIEEDAARRDFTVNALYYSHEKKKIIDFYSGINDLQTKTLRLLGDPETRYREDPVRMLRAARFSAKLDFKIEEKTEAYIYKMAMFLKDIPAARLFDECIKLFLTGYGVKSFQQLLRLDLFSALFHETNTIIKNNHSALLLIQKSLESTDQRIKHNKPVTFAFLISAFLWYPLQKRIKKTKTHAMSPNEVFNKACYDILRQQCQSTAFPKRFTAMVHDIWNLQYPLEKHHKSKIKRLIQHPRFRASYDFLMIREQSGEELHGAGAWWTAYQEKHPIKTRYTNKKPYFNKNRNFSKLRQKSQQRSNEI